MASPYEEASRRGAALSAEHAVGDPFAAAMAATRMPMIITDPRQADNPIIYANAAFLRLTGYDRDEVIGRNCRFLQGEHTDPQSIDAIRTAIAHNRDVHCELLNYRKDGSTFWNSLYLSPVNDQDGRAIYFFASQLDVTEKNLHADEVRARKDLTEKIVAVRTEELERALAAKTVLLHEVDHRVKNNLQLIASVLKLQIRRIGDREVRSSLLGILSRVEALSTVHRRLYEATDVSSFNVSAFAQELVEELIAASGRSDIETELVLEDIDVPAGKASPIALIVNELVTNCLKHAFKEDRPGKLLVRIERQNGHYCIVVHDDGVGFDGEELGRSSFGRNLVETLTRQLDGSVRWTIENGTKVVVALPVTRAGSVE